MHNSPSHASWHPSTCSYMLHPPSSTHPHGAGSTSHPPAIPAISPPLSSISPASIIIVSFISVVGVVIASVNAEGVQREGTFERREQSEAEDPFLQHRASVSLPAVCEYNLQLSTEPESQRSLPSPSRYVKASSM